MKIFHLLLSVYFFVLTAVPCADVHVNGDLCDNTIEHSHIDSTHHDNDEDNCSPLCFCHCCGGVIIQVDRNFSFDQTTFNLAPRISNTLMPSWPSYSIWQPPKLII